MSGGSIETLPVFFEHRPVGTITPAPDGPGFAYHPDWLSNRGAFPISMRMPLREAAFGPEIFLPWAENLLPEGNNLRIAGRMLGIAPADTIGILSRIGRDTAGALSIGQPGSSDPANWRLIATEAELERIIEELPRKPFLAGEDGVSMSLAGVQNKIGVGRDAEGRLYIPLDGTPSTHILKPDAAELFGGVQNEALCLTLAALCDIPAAGVTTGRAGSRSYLLVERYDRRNIDGLWRRIHQEDFCQLLDKPPAAKYERNQSGIKGPTLPDMIAVARQDMATRDLLTLLDYIVFNVIVGNTDAHAKNYSAIIAASGARLAPLYDVMHASQWEGITLNLAQTIGGKNRADQIMGTNWQRFAHDCGVNPAALARRVAQLVHSVTANVAEAQERVAAMPAGGHALLAAFAGGITQRAHTVLSNLNH